MPKHRQFRRPRRLPAPSVEDPTAEIQNLASLHDSGALSDEEFSAAKRRSSASSATDPSAGETNG